MSRRQNGIGAGDEKLLESITRKESSSYLYTPERKQDVDFGSPTRHSSPQEMISDLRLQPHDYWVPLVCLLAGGLTTTSCVCSSDLAYIKKGVLNLNFIMKLHANLLHPTYKKSSDQI
jgi:hypothetical protein